MYRTVYQEVAADGGEAVRAREHRAFSLMIERLEAVADEPVGSQPRTDALLLCIDLWRFLIRDLMDDRNLLPEAVRGDLVSVGLWASGEADRLIADGSSSFDPLIEMHRTIRDGLA